MHSIPGVLLNSQFLFLVFITVELSRLRGIPAMRCILEVCPAESLTRSNAALSVHGDSGLCFLVGLLLDFTIIIYDPNLVNKQLPRLHWQRTLA